MTRMAESAADPWEVQETDFPGVGSDEDRLRFLVSFAVLAPSGHNTQPWIFSVIDGSIDLYADRTLALPVVDPEDRELLISCGAAIFHLLVAIRRFGRRGDMALLPDPADEDLLARVSLGGPVQPTPEDLSLFEAIPRRHTNRKRFEPRPLPPALMRALRKPLQTRERGSTSSRTTTGGTPWRTSSPRAIGASGATRGFAESWPPGCTRGGGATGWRAIRSASRL